MNTIHRNTGSDTPGPSGDVLYLICVTLTAVIFIADLNLPLGVAGGAPYITVILITLWSQKRDIVIHFAVTCSVMTLVGYYFSPPGGEAWQVIFNRALALFVIWTATFLVIKWKTCEKEYHSFEKRIAVETENKKIYLATIHSAQHILNNLLNQLQLVSIKARESRIIDAETLKIFDDSLVEAQTLIKKLSAVEQIEEDKIKQSVYPEP